VPALQGYLDAVFTPNWGIPAKVRLVEGAKAPPGDWALVLVDHSADAGALGYHELTEHGCPQEIVAVRDTLDAGDTLADVISHEVVEVLVDPGTNIAIAVNPAQDHFMACEVGDPVQPGPDGSGSIEVDGFPFCNFVLKSWFEPWHKPGSVRFDYLGLCKEPLEVLESGYVSEFKHGKWGERFGSHHAQARFAKRSHARVARRGRR